VSMRVGRRSPGNEKASPSMPDLGGGGGPGGPGPRPPNVLLVFFFLGEKI